MADASCLLTELERAITDEAYDGAMGALSEQQFTQLVKTLARTALDVFEKAHAPQAMSDHLRRYQDQAATLCGCESCHDWLTESARRSEVPEPRTEYVEVGHPSGERQPVRAEPQGEPSDATVQAFMSGFFPLTPTATLDDWSDTFVDRVRAGLRAAGGVR